MGICINKIVNSSFKSKKWIEWSILCVCLIIAFYLRLGALRQIRDLPLDPDARSFITLAQKMSPFTEMGFYSAQFGMREPLYLLVAKIFFLLPGPDELNIRFISLVFSLLLVFLAYFIVRNWFGKTVGFLAAFFLAFQTYCIESSVRGLRYEFFTSLFLLFIFFVFINENIQPFFRIIGSGIFSGLLFLTRTEFLLPVTLFFLFLPLIEKNKWNISRALMALIIGIVIFIPHLWGMYRVHGDLFYTNTLNARFYTNLEFSGQPGFPSKEEINQNGMYTGPEVTPFDYFFRLHSIPEFFWRNVYGFTKIYAFLVIRYIPTKTLNILKDETKTSMMRIKYILFHHPFRCLLSILVGIGLFGGILSLWATDYRSIYLILVLFQVQTAFLFSIGLETQVVAHTWPVALWVSAFFLVNYTNRIFNKFNMNLPGSKLLSLQRGS